MKRRLIFMDSSSILLIPILGLMLAFGGILAVVGYTCYSHYKNIRSWFSSLLSFLVSPISFNKKYFDDIKNFVDDVENIVDVIDKDLIEIKEDTMLLSKAAEINKEQLESTNRNLTELKLELDKSNKRDIDAYGAANKNLLRMLGKVNQKNILEEEQLEKNQEKQAQQKSRGIIINQKAKSEVERSKKAINDLSEYLSKDLSDNSSNSDGECLSSDLSDDSSNSDDELNCKRFKKASYEAFL